MKDKTHVPGNTVLSQTLLDREMAELGAKVRQLDHQVHIMSAREEGFLSLTLRAPNDRSIQWLAIVRVSHEQGRSVGFVSGPTIAATISTVASLLMAGQIKWKDDQYE